MKKKIKKTNFEAVFPSSAHFEESSITVSADASCGTRVEERGAYVMANGAAAASGLAFAFGVLDLSLGPCPLALTFKFLHLSYIKYNAKKLMRENGKTGSTVEWKKTTRFS